MSLQNSNESVIDSQSSIYLLSYHTVPKAGLSLYKMLYFLIIINTEVEKNFYIQT